MDIAVRFWSKVDTSGACWEWTAACTDNGYGIFASRFHLLSRKAHRAAWELTNGPIPTKLLVLHHCDNRKCVNPSHLFLGTAQDNTRDAVAKGRLDYWENLRKARAARIANLRLSKLA